MVDDGGDRSGRDTWARRAGLRRVHVLAANGSEAGCGHGGSRRLQRREGNVEGTVRARVLSSHACPERRGGEALQRQPHMTGEMGRRGGGARRWLAPGAAEQGTHVLQAKAGRPVVALGGRGAAHIVRTLVSERSWTGFPGRGDHTTVA
jgi:hypothetical protein